MNSHITRERMRSGIFGRRFVYFQKTLSISIGRKIMKTYSNLLIVLTLLTMLCCFCGCVPPKPPAPIPPSPKAYWPCGRDSSKEIDKVPVAVKLELLKEPPRKVGDEGILVVTVVPNTDVNDLQ